MIVTEADAATKWCPATRVASKAFDVVAVNRPANGDPRETYPTCIGSRCMLWDWLDPDTVTERRGYCALKRSSTQFAARKSA